MFATLTAFWRFTLYEKAVRRLLRLAEVDPRELPPAYLRQRTLQGRSLGFSASEVFVYLAGAWPPDRPPCEARRLTRLAEAEVAAGRARRAVLCCAFGGIPPAQARRIAILDPSGRLAEALLEPPAPEPGQPTDRRLAWAEAL